MSRLTEQQIDDLLVQFMAALTDEKRQRIVDNLGINPINYALFAYKIGQKYSPNCAASHYMKAEFFEIMNKNWPR